VGRRVIWVIGAAALVAVYAPVLSAMGRVWWADQYAGHGMFVPAFSALLLWMDRDRLQAAAGRGEPAGLLLVALGLGFLWLGTWAGSPLLQGWSAVITVAGAVLWEFGARCLRVAAFPVGFLLVMVPLPRSLVEAVTLDLQLFAAGFAVGALRLFGIPVFHSGVVIALPNLTLQVAEVCNGLRFLMALLVLGVAFAEVTQRTWARKLILAGSTIPIAILANAVRVAVIGLGVYYVGPEAASGTIHHMIGKGVWALTLLPLIALGLVLRRGGEVGTLTPTLRLEGRGGTTEEKVA
jgi:exosortase